MNDEVWNRLNNELEELLRDIEHDELLFMKDCLEPMEFVMKPALNNKEAAILKKFKQLVEKSGGSITFNMGAGGPHSIKFSHLKHTNFSSSSDIFLSQFILDSVRRNEILNLNDYRAAKSKFTDKVDVNKILRGELSWEDAEKKLESSGEEVSDFSDEENDKLPFTDFSRSRQTSFVSKSYSRDEEKAILAYIVNNRYYYKVKGNAVWKRMEEQKVCGSRTWQSMKERFLKHIIPKINQFSLEPNIKKRVLSQFEKEVVSGSIKGVKNNFLANNSPKQNGPSQIPNSFNNRSKEKENDVENEKNGENVEKLPSVSKPKDNSPTHSNTSEDVSLLSPILLNMRVGHNTDSFGEEGDWECNELPNRNINSSPSKQHRDGVQDNLPESQDLNHVSEKESQNREGLVSATVENTENPVEVQEKDGSIPETETDTLCSTNTSGQDIQYRNILNEFHSSLSVMNEKEKHPMDGNSSDDTIIFDTSQDCTAKDISEPTLPLKDKTNSKHANSNSPHPLTDSAVSENESDMPIPLQMKVDQNNEQTKPKYSSCDSSEDEGVSKTKVNYRKAFSQNKNATKPKEMSRTSTPMKENKVKSPSNRHARNRYPRNCQKKISTEAPTSSDESDCSYRTIGKQRTYTEEDDLAILNYLYRHSCFNKIGGIVVWVEMEERAVVPGRSWHSLKERFRKRILPRIKRYKSLSPKVIQKLHKTISNQDADMGNRTRQKFNNKYSLDEDKSIIKFIIDNKRFKEIKGKAMWVAMSETRDLQGRTWESLKNRFLKNIVPNLHKFKLKDEDRCNFELALCGKSKTKFSKPSSYKKPLRIIVKKASHIYTSSEVSTDELTDISSNTESDQDLTSRERVKKQDSVEDKGSTSGSKVQSEKVHLKEKPVRKNESSDCTAQNLPSTSEKEGEFMYKCEGLESDKELDLEMRMEGTSPTKPICKSPTRETFKLKRKLYCVVEDLFAKTPLAAQTHTQPMRQPVGVKTLKVQNIVSKEGNSDKNETKESERGGSKVTDRNDETKKCVKLTNKQTEPDVQEILVSESEEFNASASSHSFSSDKSVSPSPKKVNLRSSPRKSTRSSPKTQKLRAEATKRPTRSNTSVSSRVKRRKIKGVK